MGEGDLGSGCYGFLDKELALGEVVGHAGCGAELADCLGEEGLDERFGVWGLGFGVWGGIRTAMAILVDWRQEIKYQ